MDAQYWEAYQYEGDRLYTQAEETPSPSINRIPSMTLIHVDEAKLYRTTHAGSTINYHLPSGTRRLQKRTEENVDFWDSLT